MKITFLLPDAGLTGGTRVVATYADRLQKRGHEVTVVSFPMAPPPLKQRIKAILKGHIFAKRKKSASHFDGLAIPHRIINRYRPLTDRDVPDADVVIATWWETAEWAMKLSASKGAKAYFLQHYEIFDYMPKERVMATWRLPLHKITISKWLVDTAKDIFGDDDVSLVPNSVDTKQFNAPPRQKQQQPTVGLMYSRVYWKGCDISLKAFDLSLESVPNLRLVAFGFESPSSDLPLPPGSRFVLQPPQNQIKDFYSSCDVWLCGSWSEGFCLPLLEAMACRCPVVSTEIGGPLDFVVNGVNGYMAPVGNSEELSRRIVQVCQSSDEQWKAMSDAAYATAVRYTWDDATDRFEAALTKAIAKSRTV